MARRATRRQAPSDERKRQLQPEPEPAERKGGGPEDIELGRKEAPPGEVDALFMKSSQYVAVVVVWKVHTNCGRCNIAKVLKNIEAIDSHSAPRPANMSALRTMIFNTTDESVL